MKKLIKSMLALATMALAFTACSDVPEPYDNPNNTNGKGGGSSTSLYSANLKDGQGDFVIKDVNKPDALSAIWTYNKSYGMVAAAYDSNTKTKYAAESWLVSPVIDLTAASGDLMLVVNHAINYLSGKTHDGVLEIYISDSYTDGDAIDASKWNLLTFDQWPAGSSWDYSDSKADVSAYAGKTVRVALMYKSTTSVEPTWEVGSLDIQNGKVETGEVPDTPTPDDAFYYADLKSGQGSYDIQNITVPTGLDAVWKYDSKYGMVAKAYDAASKTKFAAESWLVSPAIDLTAASGDLMLVVNHAINYLSGNPHDGVLEVYVSDSYTDKAAIDASKWTKLTVNSWPAGSSWNYSDSKADVSACAGKTIHIAFQYKSTEAIEPTWEIGSVTIKAGKVEGGTEGDETDTPVNPLTGDNILPNGDFEGWTGGLPTYWKSASSASNATLTRSTDSHSGKYSVMVATATKNKRLAYKEITLKAGSYNIEFYAKAAKDGGALCPGYVPVTDGNVGRYAYGDYTNDLSASEWTKITHQFTLTEQTVVCLIVMNPSNKSTDLLIDDYTLTTTDGGIVEGDDDGGDKGDEGNDDAILSESFATSQGAFTIDDKNLGDLSYVWKNDASYKCMKASAYASNTNHDAESWLVSPVVDLSAVTKATLAFEHAVNKYFGTVEEEAMLYAKKEGGEWTKIKISYPSTDGKTFSSFASQEVDLTAYAGSKMQFAFVYKGTAAASGTWEVKNVVVK